MINILLFVHIVIAILLIIVILMQKTGGNGTMGVVAGRTVVNFLTRTTVVLATLFMINAVILANLSSKKNSGIIKKIEQVDDKQQESSLPIAK
ncbi:preprotein translocase subunit SecG [Candidatus Tisiphia endosymbiont of Nemotelus uliginosus]|uniref:preprotein translocase subunit SecG n=1 Tax=Candidatus Tisiphia endosymbiont of Nemotelus uliginosus TaxID=3077926 RepID=UPI0035C8C109